MSSVVTAALFVAALFFTPLIAMAPDFAVAPALVIVGVYMFMNVGEINLRDFKTAAPAFLSMVLMPLTYSISIGLCFGFVSYILISIASGEIRKIHPIMWCVGVLAGAELWLQMT